MSSQSGLSLRGKREGGRGAPPRNWLSEEGPLSATETSDYANIRVCSPGVWEGPGKCCLGHISKIRSRLIGEVGKLCGTWALEPNNLTSKLRFGALAIAIQALCIILICKKGIRTMPSS